ncbi:glycosyltransferase [Azospirillum brasilense]|uniref:glycosyltransferase n=1 Tax=Azospirillum brasilense TaxID=192 RepID=UPI000E6A70F7|nr:glycosyltransferase [Azospirillum brasilense]NUB24889.1 glycosyltransferase [Azospirillum brasilense]NUB30505.1 glycosyltransferase [Azospirillum brasilense]RIW02494.1 glycosyltransferase [Azospirillum brasilense]
MRVAVLSKDPARGGAPRAMRRLIRGLRERGHRVDLLCLDHDADPAGSVGVRPMAEPGAEDAAWFFGPYIGERRTDLSNTVFTAQTVGCALAEMPVLRRYDVINIHWVAEFLSADGLAALARLGPPVVFTLHDMAPFTGGCHYSAGCEGYAAGCTPCPQLANDPLGVTGWVLERKRAGLARPNVVAASPSVWLAEAARRSRVFAGGRVHVLPNALETDLFIPTDKASAKRAFGLDPEDRVLLFGAYHAGERRKGFEHLTAMLRHMREDGRGRALLDAGRLTVATFGLAAPELSEQGVRLHDLGYIGDDRRLAAAYAAADAVVLPSLEDNQPNIMLEAMACGTPVAGFAIGGLPDVVKDRVNGRLAAPFDTAALARAVLDLVTEPAEAAACGRAARRAIEAGFTLDHQAERYEALFATMLEESGWHAEPGEGTAAGGSVAAPFRADAGFGRLYTLYRDLLAERGALEAELNRSRAELAALDRCIESALDRMRGSTARRILGRPGNGTLPSPDAPAPEKLDRLAAALLSGWWDAGAPLRLLVRAAYRLGIGRKSEGLLP